MTEKAFVDWSAHHWHREFSDHLGSRWRAVADTKGWNVYQKQGADFAFVGAVSLGSGATCFELWDALMGRFAVGGAA